MYRPCLGSGHCCKVAPCQYGEAVPGGNACRFLEVAGTAANGAVWHRCGKYEEIVRREGGSPSGMMGAGCSSPLFNPDRDALVAAGYAAHPESESD